MLTFELSIEEANVIIAALSTQPFNTVAVLINKLQTQAKPQLEPVKEDKKPKSK